MRISSATMRIFALLLVVLVLVRGGPVNADAMADMPDDPVSGEMVMTTTFNYALVHGQRLRFASADTLAAFIADPSTGLGDVVMIEETANGQDSAMETPLCPVCGMATAADGSGPRVTMKHGDQAIQTCSMTHAHDVHDTIQSFAVKDPPTAISTTNDEHGFCTGSGTTMRNGFAWFAPGGGLSPCLLLWFPGWVLDTRWRYLGGCLLVLGLAMVNEYLLRVRRVLRQASAAKRFPTRNASTSESTTLLQPPPDGLQDVSGVPPVLATVPGWFRKLSGETQHLLHSGLHGVTILLAYLLMLVSMTYDGVLFLCCIIGYIAGYYVFGERRQVGPEGPHGWNN